MGLNDHLKKITDGLGDAGALRTVKPRGAGSMPATSALSHFSEDMINLKKAVGKPIRVRMDLCDDGPHHTSPLDPERVANLKANLAENEQSSPALLQPTGDGRFRIIAGRHRKAALLGLGREEWDAIIKEIDDDTAERLTFYDNLLAPSLTDYAKFLGFAQRKKSKGMTNEQLAVESGVSVTSIARYLAFGNLPDAVQAAIQRSPAQFSGTLAKELCAFAKVSEERTLEAVNLIADGTLAPSRLAQWFTGPREPGLKVSELVIKRGKAGYAKLSRSSTHVFIKFSDEAEAESIEKELALILKARAEGNQG